MRREEYNNSSFITKKINGQNPGLVIVVGQDRDDDPVELSIALNETKKAALECSHTNIMIIDFRKKDYSYKKLNEIATEFAYDCTEINMIVASHGFEFLCNKHALFLGQSSNRLKSIGLSAADDLFTYFNKNKWVETGEFLQGITNIFDNKLKFLHMASCQGAKITHLAQKNLPKGTIFTSESRGYATTPGLVVGALNTCIRSSKTFEYQDFISAYYSSSSLVNYKEPLFNLDLTTLLVGKGELGTSDQLQHVLNKASDDKEFLDRLEPVMYKATQKLYKYEMKPELVITNLIDQLRSPYNNSIDTKSCLTDHGVYDYTVEMGRELFWGKSYDDGFEVPKSCYFNSDPDSYFKLQGIIGEACKHDDISNHCLTPSTQSLSTSFAVSQTITSVSLSTLCLATAGYLVKIIGNKLSKHSSSEIKNNQIYEEDSYLDGNLRKAVNLDTVPPEQPSNMATESSNIQATAIHETNNCTKKRNTSDLMQIEKGAGCNVPPCKKDRIVTPSK